MSILLNKAGLESDTAFKVREEFSPGAKSLAEVRHFGGVSLGDMGEGEGVATCNRCGYKIASSSRVNTSLMLTSCLELQQIDECLDGYEALPLRLISDLL